MNTVFRDMIDSTIESYINSELTSEEVIDNCDTYLDLMIESEEGEAKNTDVDFDPQTDDIGEMPKEFEDSYQGESIDNSVFEGLAELFTGESEEDNEDLENVEDDDEVTEESVNDDESDFLPSFEIF